MKSISRHIPVVFALSVAADGSRIDVRFRTGKRLKLPFSAFADGMPLERMVKGHDKIYRWRRDTDGSGYFAGEVA